MGGLNDWDYPSIRYRPISRSEGNEAAAKPVGGRSRRAPRRDNASRSAAGWKRGRLRAWSLCFKVP